MLKQPARLLFLILLGGLVLRVGFVLSQPVTPSAVDRLPDQREYLNLGCNLLWHGSLYFVDPRFGQPIYAYRMPGYPVFVAICGGSIRFARLAQCVFDTATLLAVFLIARQLSDSVGMALISVCVMVLNPFYVYFCSLLLSETLFAAAITWAIWFLIIRRWVFATILLALSCYLRPTGLLLVPVLALFAVTNRPAASAYRLWDALRRGVVISLIVIASLFPWAWRNHHVLGVWIWTTTNSGITLYDGFNLAANGGSDQRILTNVPGIGSMNEIARCRFFQEQARCWARDHWQAIPALSVKKIMRGWSPVTLSQEFGRPVYRTISAGYSVPFDLLCAVGLFSRRINRAAKLLLITPAVMVTVAQVMSVGSIRYRIPAEAPLSVLAGAGVMVLVEGRSFESRKLE